MKLAAVPVLMLIAMGPLNAAEYEMSRWTIDGGGAMFTSGGDFELSGTIAQPDAGPGSSGMSGGDFTLTGGFWFALSTDDCNSDGGVDLLDYADFESCMSGPGGGLPLPDCNCFDLDSDQDVDLSDVRRFQQVFTDG